MNKYLNLKRIILMVFSVLALNIVNAQVSSFKVKGDADKFYVVTFNDGGWFSNFATELELGRSSVNGDTSWRGSMIAKVRFHVTNWGHESEFIDVDVREDNNHFPPNAYFIAGWQDVSFDNASNNIVIWLRGGTTYFYKSNYPVNPVVYDGVAPNALTYKPGGITYSLKTAIDNNVNTYGMSYAHTAYFNGTGTNYYAGNVGIGTTKPGTYKLAVEGTIGARKINGGLREESSLVLNDGFVSRTPTGPEPEIINGVQTAKSELATLPPAKSIEMALARVEASIHSHPTETKVVGDMAYPQSANVPSDVDRTNFRQFKTNIIVGPITPLGNVVYDTQGKPIVPNRTNGISIYDSNGSRKVSLSERAVRNILNK